MSTFSDQAKDAVFEFLKYTSDNQEDWKTIITILCALIGHILNRIVEHMVED